MVRTCGFSLVSVVLLLDNQEPFGAACENKFAGIRGSTRVFAVIVTQLVTQRWEAFDTYLSIQRLEAYSFQGNLKRTYAFARCCGICFLGIVNATPNKIP
jgi:hypothetical protein